ncbi:MAG: sigma-54-dependent Fis family transcriptional regulator [Calditrichaeota bacterium]|nr:sigma-54-dependent Fis family transcriptional regulator [Calditrichota bacterium]RQW08129.1 MAG: sigma-54-dependent Fis family transcriptional regulator [Calditrichota bacterium]
MKKLGRVMVIDDEENIREVLSNYLESMNYEVTTAEDGQDALNKFTKGDFDLIISDLLMPNIDGLELLKRIRDIDKDVIFLMITGYPSIETAVDAIKKGAYDYITKPFHMEDVKLRIERAFEKRSLKDRLKTVQGLVWALLFSIPLWLILGIILAAILD